MNASLEKSDGSALASDWRTLRFFKIRYMDELEAIATWPLFNNGNQRIPIKVSFLALDAGGQELSLTPAEVSASLSLVDYATGGDPVYVGDGEPISGWGATTSPGDYVYRPSIIEQSASPTRSSDPVETPLALDYERSVSQQVHASGLQQLERLTAYKQGLSSAINALDGQQGQAELLKEVSSVDAAITATATEVDKLYLKLEAEPVPLLGVQTVDLPDGQRIGVQTYILYVATVSTTSRSLAAKLTNAAAGISVVTNAYDIQDPVGNGVAGRFHSAVTLRPYNLQRTLNKYSVRWVNIKASYDNYYITFDSNQVRIDFKSMVYQGSVDWSLARHTGKFGQWEWGFTICGQPGSTIRGQNMLPYQKNGSINEWRGIYPYMANSISLPVPGEPIILNRRHTDHWQFCWVRDGSSAEMRSKELQLTDIYGNVHRVRAHFDDTFNTVSIATY